MAGEFITRVRKQQDKNRKERAKQQKINNEHRQRVREANDKDRAERRKIAHTRVKQQNVKKGFKAGIDSLGKAAGTVLNSRALDSLIKSRGSGVGRAITATGGAIQAAKS